MAAYVVWMDYQEAKLFKLAPDEQQKHHIKLHVHKHYKHPHGKQESHHHPDAEKWFHEIADELKADATEILIIGAGEAKGLFKTFLERKYVPLGKVVVGVETVDHPTEPQLLAQTRKFFKHYDLFH
jgi:stalled ribosome rescue protein Dom34